MKDLLISQKEYLRAYSSDDINNMVGGDAWVHHMWSGDFLYLRKGLADDPTTFDFEAPTEGTPINSDAYAIPTNAKHPGTAMVFIDYLLRPENAIKNMDYLYYPFPVRDAQPAFAELAKDVPGLQRRALRPGERGRLPAARRRRGPAPRGHVDRSEGELMTAVDGHEDPALAPSAPGCGGCCSRCRPRGWWRSSSPAW